MAEEQVIITVTYDTEDAQKSVNKLTDNIVELENANKDLKAQLATGKISQQEYSKAVAANTEAIGKDKAERKDAIKFIKAEDSSIDSLRAKNAALLKQRNGLSTATKEGRDQIAAINKEYDKNNETIKANSGALEKNKQNIGNYKSALDDMPGSLGGVVQGMWGMVKASLAFIATPIGALIAIIAVTFGSLYKALTSTEAGMNKLNKIGSIFSGVFNGIMKILSPLANFIIDVVIVGFEKLGNVAQGAINLVSKGLSALGFDKAAKNVDEFNKSISESVKQSYALSEAEAKLKISQRESMKIQLDFQKLAEKQRQIRDDESLSITERTAANERLNGILQEQMATELAIAEQALEVAELRVESEGETTEALDLRAEAMTNISDIQERLTGQESEYLSNINGLRRESEAIRIADHAKAIADEKARNDARFTLGLASQAEFLAKEIADFKASDIAKLLSAEDHAKAIEAIKIKYWDKERTALGEHLEAEKDLNIDHLDADFEMTMDNEIRKSDMLLEQYQRRASFVLDTYMAMMDITDAFISGEITSWKGYLKEMVGMLVRQVQAAIYASQAKIIAQAFSSWESIASWGVAGAAKAAVIIAAATGVGALAKRGLESMADGGEIKMGTFGGNYHGQGGNNLYDGQGNLIANVEKDEKFFVLKRDASAQIGALSSLNERFGGRSFSQQTRYAAEGGEIPTQGGLSVGDVQTIIRSTPIVVQVESITAGINAADRALNVGVI